MSVVSSRSTTLSSILTTSGHRARQLQRQSLVTFVPPRHLKKILVNFETKSDRKTYANLICMIRDAKISDADMINFLNEVRQCISFLGPSHKLLVEALLNIPWTTRSQQVTTAYKAFLDDLICVHIYHCKGVIDKLVSCFKPVVDAKEEETTQDWPDGIPTDSDVTRLNHIHSVLEKCLKIVPMSSNLLLQALSAQFPYFKATAHTHEVYIYSLLQVTHYAPALRQEILSLVINRLLILDVHAPRAELEGYGDEDDEEGEAGVFDFEQEESDKQPKKFHPIGQTLDICMEMIFGFVHQCCHPQGDLDPEGVKKIYFDLLAVFEKIVLPTYASHHVQFVFFYLCSFKVSIVEAFIKWLWGKLSNPNVAPITRQSAVCYLVSLLARGNYIPISLINRVIQEMSNWIHSYISAQDSLECANSDVRSHTVFYAICQGLFYIIAFRHKDLTDANRNLIFLQNLNLTKIVSCKLNPLKICLPVIAQHFAAVTRTYQLAYCYTIMEHNARSNLPVLQTSNRLTSWLDTFFPFDPYILPKSYERICPLYLQYQGNINIEVEEDDIRQEEENDEDDFMDISHVEARSHLDMFSYSTSPGFIQS